MTTHYISQYEKFDIDSVTKEGLLLNNAVTDLFR